MGGFMCRKYKYKWLQIVIIVVGIGEDFGLKYNLLNICMLEVLERGELCRVLFYIPYLDSCISSVMHVMVLVLSLYWS